jgi:hypothetical protein
VVLGPTFLGEAMVPTESVMELIHGSYDALSYRLEEAIEESRAIFTDKEEIEVGRVATFEDHAIVGTSDGVYFKVAFTDKDGDINLLLPERLDVQIVESKNAAEYVGNFAMSAVDALLGGDLTESKDRLLALSKMQEGINREGLRDLVAEAKYKLAADRPWRVAFGEQRQIMDETIGDDLQRIREESIRPIFAPLYDGTIEEEDFPGYHDQAVSALERAAARFEAVKDSVRLSYGPFAESLKGVNCTEEEGQTLELFGVFAEDLAIDADAIREHIAYAIENEECVMCLGQIHDMFAESLYEYEVAGKFIECMAHSFTEASQ